MAGTETTDDRARVAFGQSLQSERWAVRYNELAWKARKARLMAFEAREAGCSNAAALHEKDAASCEALMGETVTARAQVFSASLEGG